MRALRIIVACLALAGTSGANAVRVIDYKIDEPTAEKYAAEQGLAPLLPMPARSDIDVRLQIEPTVDHEVVRGGINCSAWSVRNPISQLVHSAFMAWDRDGAVEEAGTVTSISVHIETASTLSRCVLTGELAGVCISRVSIGGETRAATRNGGNPEPFRIEVERSAKSVGACAGLTRGIGLISREAVIKMLKEVATRATS